MNQEVSAAGKPAARPVLKLAMTVGLSLVVAGVNAIGASAGAQELRPSTESELRYDDAMRALMDQRYAAAYGRFAALADQGHAPSALMALAMVRYRPTVFGGEWSATPAQLLHWSALAAHDVQSHSHLVVAEHAGE